MTDRSDDPTPEAAAAALESIARLRQVAVQRGLLSRPWAIAMSLWVGAMAVATAFDGGAATGAIGALTGAGMVAAALRRRQIVARVRAVHGVPSAIVVLASSVALLAIGLFGAAVYERLQLPWVPLATGGVVAAVLFVTLEVLRRRMRDRATTGWA